MHGAWGFAAIVCAAGCNQFFGLRETGQQDAAPKEYFDAPLDAPFACPALGEPPHFSRLVNVIAQDCSQITLSSPPTSLLARCGPNYALSFGPLEGDVLEINVTGLEAGANVNEAKLTPEGDRFYARVNGPAVARLVQFSSVVGTTLWSESLNITVPGGVSTYIQPGIPSRGPVRRVMVLNGTANIVELEVSASGAAIEVASYTFSELGVFSIYQVPNLSEDGLRIIYNGEDDQGVQHITYNARASIGDRFTQPASLPELPRVYDAYLNTDCSRVYFSGISLVFWVQRQ